VAGSLIVSKKMKRFLPIIPSLGLLLQSCGSNPNPTPPAEKSTPQTATNTASEPESPKPKSGESRQFFVTGVVEGLKLGEGKVIVRHEDIPEFMEAMTMPFNVKNTNEFSAIGTNDQIHFRLVVEETRSWIDRVTRVGSVAAMKKPRREFRRVRDVEPLKVGDVLPNYPLTNQFGKLFHTDDYRGQALAFTFIFTRCPMPEFCPLMSRNFKKVYEEMQNDASLTNWQLLTISFDVEADTPKVLNGYSKIHGVDSSRWNFATGALIEIDDITERFGLAFSRMEGTILFDHTLRSVILDPQGKIDKIYIGNAWKPEDFAKDLKAAALIKPAQ
tara:strand:+ start:3908 stop:4897 length:990 start_codon:yes stop_codon:yes gene_type:complete